MEHHSCFQPATTESDQRIAHETVAKDMCGVAAYDYLAKPMVDRDGYTIQVDDRMLCHFALMDGHLCLSAGLGVDDGHQDDHARPCGWRHRARAL